jgi:predicted NBD/HSP70 family sugar kinase
MNPTPRGWPELHQGQRSVLSQLIVSGPQPRADLARTVGRSAGSLTRISRELIDLGLVLPGETAQTRTRGRPSEDLAVRADAAHFVGVKLTGDALHAVAADLDSSVVASERVELGRRDVTGVVELIVDTAGRLFEGRACHAGIGVCLAGDVENLGGVAYLTDSPFLGWEGPVPLERLVARATGLPTVVNNDVQALTTGHHWFGPGAGASSLVVLAVGAGIGAGFVVDHAVVTGAHGRQGKIGHLRVDVEGSLRCSLGHTSCANALVTMPSITANAGAGDYEQVVVAAGRGEAGALAAFRAAATALGAVVAHFVNVLDPEMVLVTGEGLDMVELAAEHFELAVADHLDARAIHDGRIRIEPFSFSDYARGAAVTAMRHVVCAS